MNIKPILRYQLSGHFQVFRVLYGIIYAIFAAVIISKYVWPASTENVNISTSDLTTMITIFIVGLTFFKDPFRFYISSGVSRKRFFAGMISALGITSAATALLDCVNALIFSQFLNYHSLYQMLLNPEKIGTLISVKTAKGIETGEVFYKIAFTPSMLLKNFLWCVLAYFVCAMIGLFITVLYYRMSKVQKVIVSVSVPSFFLFVLPILDEYVARGSIGAVISKGFEWWVNCGVNPAADIITRLLLAAVLAGITYYMVRKAEVKA
ncbi:MAG TPA: hypothetical protein VHP31_03430 [Caproicibacter sp.]|nr:hypothetical protein [Caproicibacter sp.]